jgi:uncharacterized protein
MRQIERGLGRGKIYPHEHARQLLNPFRRLLQSPSRAAQRLALTPDARVLELGCGPGYFSVELARRVPDGMLCLFDFQREMLQMALDRLAAAGVRTASGTQGDALALPFAGASFDAVLLVTVLGEVGDPAGCLREVHRTLRPGGLLSIAETRGDADFIARSELRALAEAHGFTLERAYGMRWNYTLTFRRP